MMTAISISCCFQPVLLRGRAALSAACDSAALLSPPLADRGRPAGAAGCRRRRGAAPRMGCARFVVNLFLLA